jgi:predicted lactoylglutathione lyase
MNSEPRAGLPDRAPMTAPNDLPFFLNLPVADPQRTRAYYTELGFAFDDRFSNEHGQCMLLSDKAYVMWLTQPFFDTFTKRPRADPQQTTSGLYCIMQPSRPAVDAFVDRALALGGAPAAPTQDHGFMYGRSFFDLDGHHWEVGWMDMEAACPPAT